ncbi:jg3569 [Pararge aegeria aegeria]|uniref:Jg3569 protein n=1 Tax=Pararge aegeria aegeria TaxID=348720 RepID=A0A8S4RJH2_9NEOP|nr:jg3569 [Pararge aegeria aegeria]
MAASTVVCSSEISHEKRFERLSRHGYIALGKAHSLPNKLRQKLTPFSYKGSTAKKYQDPPIGTEHCDWLYGIFGHETSCTRYWTCWNGTATEQLCIGGLLYNENAHSCDWPENVDGCQKHPLCNEDANGNVPLGKSCNRYWQCQGGYPRLQRCPAMLVFDRRSLRCVVPPTEDCEIPTTTTPQPEEEDVRQSPQQPSKRPSNNEYQDGQGRQRQRN